MSGASGSYHLTLLTSFETGHIVSPQFIDVETEACTCEAAFPEAQGWTLVGLGFEHSLYSTTP